MVECGNWTKHKIMWWRGPTLKCLSAEKSLCLNVETEVRRVYVTTRVTYVYFYTSWYFKYSLFSQRWQLDQELLTLCALNMTIVNLRKNPIFTRSCLKEQKDKSLLSLYWLVICVKLNETKVLNIFHLKYILNTWFWLKIHNNYLLSLSGA